MLNENFFDKFETKYDRFISYRPIRPIIIFSHKVEPTDCIISIFKELTWIEVSPILEKYLEWLATCKSKLFDYFRLKLGTDLPEEWLENIEIYSVDITFLALNDFGATVSFGESLFPDHIIELDFDKFEIDIDRLNG